VSQLLEGQQDLLDRADEWSYWNGKHFIHCSVATARFYDNKVMCTLLVDLQVALTGESASIVYLVVHCGLQPYDRVLERELHISNTGKVAFDSSIDLSHLSRPGVIEASMMTGKVAAGDKAHIKIKVLSLAGVTACVRFDVINTTCSCFVHP